MCEGELFCSPKVIVDLFASHTRGETTESTSVATHRIRHALQRTELAACHVRKVRTDPRMDRLSH